MLWWIIGPVCLLIALVVGTAVLVQVLRGATRPSLSGRTKKWLRWAALVALALVGFAGAVEYLFPALTEAAQVEPEPLRWMMLHPILTVLIAAAAGLGIWALTHMPDPIKRFPWVKSVLTLSLVGYIAFVVIVSGMTMPLELYRPYLTLADFGRYMAIWWGPLVFISCGSLGLITLWASKDTTKSAQNVFKWIAFASLVAVVWYEFQSNPRATIATTSNQAAVAVGPTCPDNSGSGWPYSRNVLPGQSVAIAVPSHCTVEINAPMGTPYVCNYLDGRQPTRRSTGGSSCPNGWMTNMIVTNRYGSLITVYFRFLRAS